jgi:RNA recognition motif-containing protein
MSSRSTLYVGNVDYSVQAPNLTNLFEKYGEITSVQIKRGYAFVKFETEDSAQAAMEALNNHIFYGRNIRINFSKLDEPLPPQFVPQSPPNPPSFQKVPYNKNSIHVANLPFQINEQILLEEYSPFGVIKVDIIRKRNCFAIIELSSEENVISAIEEKNGHVIEGRTIVVSKQMEGPPRRASNFRGRGGFRGGYSFRGFRNDREDFSPNQVPKNNHNNNNNRNANNVANLNLKNNDNNSKNRDNNNPRWNSGYGRGYRGNSNFNRGGRGFSPAGAVSFPKRGYFYSNQRGQFRGNFRGNQPPRDGNFSISVQNE